MQCVASAGANLAAIAACPKAFDRSVTGHQRGAPVPRQLHRPQATAVVEALPSTQAGTHPEDANHLQREGSHEEPLLRLQASAREGRPWLCV